jgi:hypothetical protein
MKRFVIAILFVQFTVTGFSQSKLFPASTSALSGIVLPSGSQQDKRILSTAAAKTLLNLIADENKIQLADGIEVFVLPLSTVFEEKLKQSSQVAGWKMNAIPNESNYWLLVKNEQSLMMYLSASKKDIQLYLSPILPLPQNSTAVTQSAAPAQATPAPPTKEKTEAPPTAEVPAITSQSVKTSAPAIASVGAFTFTTTNFNDGWVSTVHTDWVEVAKSNVKVLIHYPNPTTNQYISDPDEAKRIAWNTLVAPRYNNLQNYFIAKSALSYIQGSFISGTLTDKQTGQTVYVALFHRDKSPWMEFIAPDIHSFGLATGFDVSKLNGYVENEAWDPLQKLEGYNKFSVAASDLTGTWTNNFSGFQQYVNTSTGADAGMNTHASTQIFEFISNGNYNWSISVASGFVGNIKFSGAKSSGKFTIPNNWQITFSDLEGKPKLYNAFFSCVKGARILWLQDTQYGDYSSYGKRE